MPICAEATRTERTHRTSPDEHYPARPNGTSVFVDGAPLREVREIPVVASGGGQALHTLQDGRVSENGQSDL